MKNLKDILNNTILEKLSVDDIILDAKFPIDGTLNDIIKFLEDNDFNYVHCGRGIDEYFNKYKSRCFYRNDARLWFADTSNKTISKENPIFMYRIFNNTFGVYYCNKNGIMCWLVGENNANTKENNANTKENKGEFLRELNKRFGWE